jgi:hypothetical protein
MWATMGASDGMTSGWQRLATRCPT